MKPMVSLSFIMLVAVSLGSAAPAGKKLEAKQSNEQAQNTIGKVVGKGARLGLLGGLVPIKKLPVPVEKLTGTVEEQVDDLKNGAVEALPAAVGDAVATDPEDSEDGVEAEPVAVVAAKPSAAASKQGQVQKKQQKVVSASGKGVLAINQVDGQKQTSSKRRCRQRKGGQRWQTKTKTVPIRVRRVHRLGCGRDRAYDYVIYVSLIVM